MKLQFLVFLLALMLPWDASAAPSDTLPCPPVHLNGLLHCALQSSGSSLNVQKVGTAKKTDEAGVKLQILSFQSGLYPEKPVADIPQTLWKHTIEVYIPDVIQTDRILLFVTGGSTHSDSGSLDEISTGERINFAKLASENKALVAVLLQVPNQHLLMGSEWRKEDNLVAYSYARVMDNPGENGHLAAHIPMARAVVRAIDALEQFVKTDLHRGLGSVFLSGASKRAWAVTLAALEDSRVGMLMPIVLDIFHVEDTIEHIMKFYEGEVIRALRDYEKHDVISRIHTIEFRQLMAIEDPMSYLEGPYKSHYRERFSLPKYFLQASGDDFFPPDASHGYFTTLPGKSWIRYLPNSMHYIVGNPLSTRNHGPAQLESTWNTLFYAFIHDTQLPVASITDDTQTFTVVSDQKPNKVVLWTSQNPLKRDFRCIASYDKLRLLWTYIQSFFGQPACQQPYFSKELDFTCEGKSVPSERSECRFNVSLPNLVKGYQADFLELHYLSDDHPFIITSQVSVRETK